MGDYSVAFRQVIERFVCLIIRFKLFLLLHFFICSFDRVIFFLTIVIYIYFCRRTYMTVLARCSSKFCRHCSALPPISDALQFMRSFPGGRFLSPVPDPRNPTSFLTFLESVSLFSSTTRLDLLDLLPKRDELLSKAEFAFPDQHCPSQLGVRAKFNADPDNVINNGETRCLRGVCRYVFVSKRDCSAHDIFFHRRARKSDQAASRRGRRGGRGRKRGRSVDVESDEEIVVSDEENVDDDVEL
jgi:hypothetical protein